MTTEVKNSQVSENISSLNYAPAVHRHQTIPEFIRKVVNYCVGNSAHQISKKEVLMDTPTTSTVVETPAVVVDNVPQIVAIRNGKKGPGKEIVVVATLADANLVKADLLPTLPAGSEVIFRPLTQTVVMTYTSWAENAKAANEAAAKRQAVLASLSPEQIAALGL